MRGSLTRLRRLNAHSLTPASSAIFPISETEPPLPLKSVRGGGFIVTAVLMHAHCNVYLAPTATC
jgi:hypothetical protein